MFIVNKDNQAARKFRLTIGLVEGYGKGRLHTSEEVGEIVAGWLLRQKSTRSPYLPGSITPSMMVYCKRNSAEGTAEPIVFFEGIVSPEYNSGLTNGEVLSALRGLAEILANELNQDRIYLEYDRVIQILEREK